MKKTRILSAAILVTVLTSLAACSTDQQQSTSESEPVKETQSTAAVQLTSDTESVDSSTQSPEQTSETVDSNEQEQLNIWYVNPLISYPAFKMSSDLFEDYAKDHNVVATVVGPSKIDIPAMITGMDQAIADGANGIITCDLDPKAFDAQIKKAQDAGVVVVTIGCTDDISDFSLGTDNKQFGIDAADLIAKNAGEAAKVGIITSDNSTPNQVEQTTAFKSRLEERYPNVTIAAWEYDNSDSATAATKIAAMMQANPDIDALWCVDGNCPAGVESGLNAAGVGPNKVYALGIDAVDNTIAAIEAGWITETLNQCYFIASPLAVELIRSKIEGTTPAERSYGIPADPVSIANLPYAGCPNDVVPTLN